MKKLLTLLFTTFLLMPGLFLEGQVITSIEEDFEDGLISDRWQPEHGDTIYTLTNVDDGDGKVLQIDVDKNIDNNNGFAAIRYTMEEGTLLDIADNPYLSLRVKANADVPLQINLMADGYNWGVTAITYNIAGNGEWVDLIYDFSSVLVDTIDASAVKTLLINFNPGWQLWYTGTVWFDDFKGLRGYPLTHFQDKYKPILRNK